MHDKIIGAALPSVQALSFLGDAVHSLYVRRHADRPDTYLGTWSQHRCGKATPNPGALSLQGILIRRMWHLCYLQGVSVLEVGRP